MNEHESLSVNVRAATRDDVVSLVDFSMAMAQETEERVLERERLAAGVSRVIESPTHGYYTVAEASYGAQPPVMVGQLLITYEWSDWRNAMFWWVQSVYVKREWRRRGIFRALYQDAKARAEADEHVCGLRLYVEEHNAGALATYQRLGLARTAYRILEDDFVFRPDTCSP